MRYISGWDWTEIACQLQNKQTKSDEEANKIIDEHLGHAISFYCNPENKDKVDKKAERCYNICREFHRKHLEGYKKWWGDYNKPLWLGLYKIVSKKETRTEKEVYLGWFLKLYERMWH